MNFTKILSCWIVSFSFISSSYCGEKVLQSFGDEFNDYFFSILVPRFSQYYEFLSLLDYPETLQFELLCRSDLLVSEIPIVALNHFRMKMIDIYTDNKFIKNGIERDIGVFCAKFSEANDNERSKLTSRSDDNGLIFPVETDCTQYLNHHHLIEDSGNWINKPADITRREFDIISSAFDQFKTIHAEPFLEKCKLFGILYLFNEFTVFANLLKCSILQSIIQTHAHFEYFVLFIGQSFDAYFLARNPFFQENPDKAHLRDTFIKPFQETLETFWLEMFDKLEINEKSAGYAEKDETVGKSGYFNEKEDDLGIFEIEEELSWIEMSERIQSCRFLFIDIDAGPIGQTFVSELMSIIKKVKSHCCKCNSDNVPFDLRAFIAFMDASFADFFKTNLMIPALVPLLKKLKEKFVTLFGGVLLQLFPSATDQVGNLSALSNLNVETSFSTDSSRESELENKRIIQKILAKFISLTLNLPAKWVEVKEMLNDDNIFEDSLIKVKALAETIKKSANDQCKSDANPDDFLSELKSSMERNIESVEFPDDYEEFFRGFIAEFYEQELFSCEPGEIEAVKLPIELPENLLDDPSEFIQGSRGDSDKIEALAQFYSHFIETEFQSLKNNFAQIILSEYIKSSLL